MWFCEITVRQLFVLIITILSWCLVICGEGRQEDAAHFNLFHLFYKKKKNMSCGDPHSSVMNIISWVYTTNQNMSHTRLLVFPSFLTETKLETRVILRNIRLSETLNYNKVMQQCATLPSINFFQGVKLQDDGQQWLTAKTFQNEDFFCLIEKFQWDYRGRLWNGGFPAAVPGASIVKMLCDVSDQSKPRRPSWFSWCGLWCLRKNVPIAN